MRCSKCGSRSVTLYCQGDFPWMECTICGHVEKGEPVGQADAIGELPDTLRDDHPETI